VTPLQSTSNPPSSGPPFFSTDQYLPAEPSRVEEDQRMDQMAFAEVQRINADYYQDRLAERAECQYGHTNLTSEQWARLQEEL